jgi:hypothetical protein
VVTRPTLFRSVVCRTLLVAFVASLLPSPARAEGVKETPRSVNLQAEMTKVVQRDLAKEAVQPRLARPAASRVRAQSADPAKESPSFFKSRTGIIVLGVLAAGAGYAIYSTQNDRINSPGRE